jgi:3-hydroxyacyl-CoA dehydrogenase/enoyl-CoA hydratase/3-hydroxybutyryl-CoA epimerase
MNPHSIGFPLPDDAPEAGACIRVQRPEPGLAVVVFDPPHRSFPIFDAPLLRDLDAVLTELEGDAALRGIVFTGRKPTQFLAGADVEAIGTITDPGVVEDVVRSVHALFDRVARLAPRTVAAVGGPVPGGAFEFSMCCDRIVAVDGKSTRIGLPETMLGILPGWGGSHRLPRRVGIPTALDAILTGRLLPAKPALKRGFVDRLAHEEDLVRIASDIAMGRKKCARRSRGAWAWLVDRNPLARTLIRDRALKGVDAKARGKYPAPYAALDLVLSAPGAPQRTWAGREAKAVAELATGPVCKSLVGIFFASEAAKKLGKGAEGVEPPRPAQATVVGAGVMGAGIASALALAGVPVRLADLSSKTLAGAVASHRTEVEKRRKKRRLSSHEANAAVDRLDPVAGATGMARSEFAIEAVAEVLEVKRKVLGGLAEQLPAHAILATNTSSLSVGAIAEGLPHPERVVGMHFFNPVKAMPLVEVVRGPETSDEVVTRTCALALALGKTPVVTRDVPGFLVNRILGPYLDEAVRLFLAGAEVERVDRLMLDFGMPMGPYTLLDEVGFDIAQHAAASLHAGYGDRMAPCPGLEGLAQSHRLGRKTGLGFYKHPAPGDRKAKRVVAEDLASFQTGHGARALSDADLVDRLVLAMVGEAARCLEEQVVESEQVLDLASVFGTGFAPFRGGLWSHARKTGYDRVATRMRELQQAPDIAERGAGAQRFEPTGLLS